MLSEATLRLRKLKMCCCSRFCAQTFTCVLEFQEGEREGGRPRLLSSRHKGNQHERKSEKADDLLISNPVPRFSQREWKTGRECRAMREGGRESDRVR